MASKPYEPTKGDRAFVKIAAADAVPQDEIAQIMGLSPKTLRKHFRAELHGPALAELRTRVHANFARIALGDSKAAAWAAERWLRMRAPEMWHDPPTQIANAPGEALAIQVITGVPRATDTGETTDKAD